MMNTGEKADVTRCRHHHTYEELNLECTVREMHTAAEKYSFIVFVPLNPKPTTLLS